MSSRLLECIKPVSGFIVGKSYKMVSCSGKYVEIIDENGSKEIMLDIYFSGAGKRLCKSNK